MGGPLQALCVTVGKPERFVRRFFQAACGNHQEEAPKATVFDFLSCGSFHSAPRSLFGGNAAKRLTDCVALKKKRPQAATWGSTRVINPLSQEQINGNRFKEERITNFGSRSDQIRRRTRSAVRSGRFQFERVVRHAGLQRGPSRTAAVSEQAISR